MHRNHVRQGGNMAVDLSSGNGTQQQTPASLLTLAEYLELALDMGGSLIMMRPRAQTCVMYIGDPAGSHDDLRSFGTIEAVLADEILRLTHAGINFLEIDGPPYRFVRSFRHIDSRGAIVFASA
ncbi:hypothetical protein [Paraburkholderia piptadeniae]|nr:hypothetical protein [Paraburkholderia piptadeniae]